MQAMEVADSTTYVLKKREGIHKLSRLYGVCDLTVAPLRRSCYLCQLIDVLADGWFWPNGWVSQRRLKSYSSSWSFKRMPRHSIPASICGISPIGVESGPAEESRFSRNLHYPVAPVGVACALGKKYLRAGWSPV